MPEDCAAARCNWSGAVIPCRRDDVIEISALTAPVSYFRLRVPCCFRVNDVETESPQPSRRRAALSEWAVIRGPLTRGGEAGLFLEGCHKRWELTWCLVVLIGNRLVVRFISRGWCAETGSVAKQGAELSSFSWILDLWMRNLLEPQRRRRVNDGDDEEKERREKPQQ